MPLPIDTELSTHEKAKAIVNRLAELGNNAIEMLAESCAVALANVWMPSDVTPPDVIGAMKTAGARFFAEHRRAITYLWSDDDTRAVFIKACERHGVTCEVISGLPEFPCVQETTTHNDGTVTVNA